MPLKKSPVRMSHAKQMKHYWGCFIKQNNCKSLEEMRNASKAPLQHLCNNHDYCNSEWCGQKKAFEKGKVFRNDNVSKTYLDLNNNVDRQVYDDILHITKQFSTDKMLLESLHQGNTQANESLNNSLSYFAPKNINYARSSSFINRVSVNGGIQIYGYLLFFSNVFDELGVNFSNSICIYLSKKDKKKGIVRNIRKSREYKRKRKFQSEAKKMEEIFQDRMREEKGMGTYQSGVGVQISTNRKKPKHQAAVKDKTCACGSNTHMRRSSSKCPQRHWSPKQIDEFNRTKIVPSKFQICTENDSERKNNEISLRQCCTVIYTT